MRKLLVALGGLFLCLAANAQNVAIGSLTASGADCTTAGACVTLQFEGNDVASASIQLSGTFTATVQFEASSDRGTTWVAISGTPLNSSAGVTSATTANTWKFNVASITNIRARASAWTSAPTVVIRSSRAFAANPFTGGTLASDTFFKSGRPWYDVMAFGALCDGSTDDTTAINLAITTASTAGGGIVFVPRGTCITSGVVMKDTVWLHGSGMNGGTILKLKAATSGSLVSLSTTDTQNTILSDIELEGNVSNQSVADDNLRYDTTGTASDRHNQIFNVWSQHAKGSGIVFIAGRGEARITNVFSYFNDVYGFSLSTPDLHCTGCDAGQNGKQGFNVTLGNVHFVNSKAWLSGRLDTANGDGFLISGANRVTLAGTEAQDNAGSGFSFLNVFNISAAGINADSNGTGTTAAGIKLDGVSYSYISGTTGDRNGSPLQAYGIQFANTNTNNAVFLTSRNNLTSDTNGTIASTNNVEINGSMIAGTALSLGTNPAVTGPINLANNAYVYGRNNANGADVKVAGVRTDDGVALGADYITAYSSQVTPGADNTRDLGSTSQRWKSGWFAANITNQTGNAAQWVQGQASELLTLSTGGTTTDTAANLLPANSIILGVVARVTTTITTATSWQLGDATTAGRFTTANATMTAGTTDVGKVHLTTGIASATTGMWQTAAAKVRVTTVGTPGAGVIRITVFYIQLVPPTS